MCADVFWLCHIDNIVVVFLAMATEMPALAMVSSCFVSLNFKTKIVFLLTRGSFHLIYKSSEGRLNLVSFSCFTYQDESNDDAVVPNNHQVADDSGSDDYDADDSGPDDQVVPQDQVS